MRLASSALFAAAWAPLLLLAACGTDSGGGSLPSTGDDGGASDGSGEGEGEADGADGGQADDPQCVLGQVLRDGRCLDTCNTEGLACDPDAEVCVRFEGDRGCYPACGTNTGDCAIGQICLVVVDSLQTEGFCAEGDCPAGSHPGAGGWCVCDSGDIPPPDLPCKVELCGQGNRNGECVEPNEICVDGVCK